ncbi:MAG: hypothetical protein KBD78_06480 [Oligoflexales bacterium]|nr:hypothetical protein [Oligoflexales bacterium]
MSLLSKIKKKQYFQQKLEIPAPIMILPKFPGLFACLFLAQQLSHPILLAGDLIPLEYKSGKMLGRGHSGLSTADEEDAIFYNPAGLAQGKGIYKKTVLLSPMLEFSSDTRDLIREVAVEEKTDVETLRKHIGQPQHLGISNFSGVIFRRAAIGLFGNGQSDILISKSPEAGGLEQVDAGADIMGGLSFSLADSFFHKNLYFGITSKYLYRGEAGIHADLAEYDELQKIDPADSLGMGNGFGLDYGMMWRGEGRVQKNFGLTVKNIGQTAIDPIDDASNAAGPIEQTINIGTSFVTAAYLSQIEFHFDIWDLTSAYTDNFYLKTHLGAELNLKKFIGLSAGLNQGYPTVGMFFDVYFLRLDLGAYTEEVGDNAGTRPDKRFYFRLAGGF